MAIQKAKVTSVLVNNSRVEATDNRGHKVTIDEPINSGGTNKGMNPIEMVLAGLGSCLTLSARLLAPHFGVDIREFSVEVEGDVRHEGFLGLADFRPGLLNVRYTYHIRTYADEDTVKKFIEHVESHCPVTDTVKNPVKISAANIFIADPTSENSEKKIS